MKLFLNQTPKAMIRIWLFVISLIFIQEIGSIGFHRRHLIKRAVFGGCCKLTKHAERTALRQKLTGLVEECKTANHNEGIGMIYYSYYTRKRTKIKIFF